MIVRWLLETQVRPAFGALDWIERAYVCVIPRHWKPGTDDDIRFAIFYSHSSQVRLDDAVDAMVKGTQDPNLPAGVVLDDLFAPIRWLEGSHDAPPPITIADRMYYEGCTRHPEYGHYEVLDAFAQFADVRRGHDGPVMRLPNDTLRERMDRWLEARHRRSVDD